MRVEVSIEDERPLSDCTEWIEGTETQTVCKVEIKRQRCISACNVSHLLLYPLPSFPLSTSLSLLFVLAATFWCSFPFAFSSWSSIRSLGALSSANFCFFFQIICKIPRYFYRTTWFFSRKRVWFERNRDIAILKIVSSVPSNYCYIFYFLLTSILSGTVLILLKIVWRKSVRSRHCVFWICWRQRCLMRLWKKEDMENKLKLVVVGDSFAGKTR